MSQLEQRILTRSGLWAPARQEEQAAAAEAGKSPRAFTLPSDVAVKKGVRNPLDIRVAQLPKLYTEPANTLNQYARVDDAAHVRPSDRIGRNYTVTAKMLTVDAIERSARSPAAGGAAAANPFSRADLQSINVPVVLDPLNIPVHKGKGSSTLVPSPKRSDRKRYSADQWDPTVHGAISNDVGAAASPSRRGGGGGGAAVASPRPAPAEAHKLLLNFEDAVDTEPDDQVLPLKQQWILHCLRKVRKYHGAPGAEQMLTAMLHEVHSEYVRSVKTGIVEYKILSPRGASRANVDTDMLRALKNWQPEQSRWNVHLTHEWRVLRQTGIEEKAILASKEKIWSIFNTLGSAMGRLQQLWLSRVGGLRLCDNRFTNFDTDREFQQQLPFPVPAFGQRLVQEITRVRSTLKTSWLVASGFILTQHLKYYKEALHFNLFGTASTSAAGRTPAELAREEREFGAAEEVSLRSANVLMSRQLREIVGASVEDLVEFFRHKSERGQPALVVSVEVNGPACADGAEGTAAFQLTPGVPDVVRALEKCVDDITDADKNFPSIELLVRPKADPKQPFLQACRVQPSDDIVDRAKASLRAALHGVRAAAEGCLKAFAPFADLFNGVEEGRCAKLVEDMAAGGAGSSTARTLAKFSKEVERYQELASRARQTLPPSVSLPVFAVDARHAIDEIVARCEQLADRLLETVVAHNRAQMKAVCEEFDRMQQILLSNPDDSAKLQELQEYWGKCDDIMARLQKTIQAEVYTCTKFVFALGRVTGIENAAHIYSDDTRLLHKVLEWPNKIKDFFEASKRMQDGRRDELLAVLKLRKDTFSEELKDMERKLTKLVNQQDYSTESVHTSLEMVTSLRALFSEATFEAERINAQENELQIDEGPTDYEERLKLMHEQLDPLDQLWTLVSEYSTAMDQWMNHPLNTIDAEAADTTADNLRRGILKLKKVFEKLKIKQPASVATTIAGELKTFLQEMVPLMTLICTPGLKDRHWEDINKITGLDIERTPALSLFDIADFHLEHYAAQIEETCITAVKEFSLEKALVNMEGEWDEINFTCKPYRETGTYILAEIDEVQQLLDDQIVKIQAMRSSRCACVRARAHVLRACERADACGCVPWLRWLSVSLLCVRRRSFVCLLLLLLLLLPSFGLLSFDYCLSRARVCVCLCVLQVHQAVRGSRVGVGEVAAQRGGDHRELAQGAGHVAVPGADLLVGRHPEADAGGERALPHRGRHVARVDGGHGGGPQGDGGGQDGGPRGAAGPGQRAAGADPERAQRLPGDQAALLPALLLPLQRRAAGDPGRDQGPPARAAAPQEVLRGHQQAQLRRGPQHRGHGVQGGRGDGVPLRALQARGGQPQRRPRPRGALATAGGDRHAQGGGVRHGLLHAGVRQVGAHDVAQGDGGHGGAGDVDEGVDARRGARAAAGRASVGVRQDAVQPAGRGGDGARQDPQDRPQERGRAGGHRRAQPDGGAGHDRAERQEPRRVRVAVADALLLDPGRTQRHHRRPRLARVQDDHLDAAIRVRVPRPVDAPGHHAAHGPLLPHHDGRHRAQLRRRPRGPSRHGQDRDGQGPGQDAGHALRRVQLLRRPGLPRHGQVLQGPGRLGRVGVLRRVQPHRARGAVGDRAADPHHPARQDRQADRVLLRGHAAGPPSDGQRVRAFASCVLLRTFASCVLLRGACVRACLCVFACLCVRVCLLVRACVRAWRDG
jgi:hypothetical protein